MLSLRMIIDVSVTEELEMGDSGAERVVDNTQSAIYMLLSIKLDNKYYLYLF